MLCLILLFKAFLLCANLRFLLHKFYTKSKRDCCAQNPVRQGTRTVRVEDSEAGAAGHSPLRGSFLPPKPRVSRRAAQGQAVMRNKNLRLSPYSVFRITAEVTSDAWLLRGICIFKLYFKFN